MNHDIQTEVVPLPRTGVRVHNGGEIKENFLFIQQGERKMEIEMIHGLVFNGIMTRK
jgi:hypothetical protein